MSEQHTGTSDSPAAIAALRRYNVIAALAHAVQAGAVLLLANGFSLPVTATYMTGPEYQVLDDAAHLDGRNELTSAGAVYGLYPAPRGIVKRAGEWNAARLLVNGNHVEHWLNGQRIAQYELGSPEWAQKVAASKFNDWKGYGKFARGRIALQDHGDQVSYRNIRIRVLP